MRTVRNGGHDGINYRDASAGTDDVAVGAGARPLSASPEAAAEV
jgi:hypothetical protein